MNAVFLDTVGLLAIWDVSDQWHNAAEAAYLQITAKRLPFVTTRFVLLECGNAAARRSWRKEAAQLRQTLERRGELIVPTDEDWASTQRPGASGSRATSSALRHAATNAIEPRPR